jgi:hypothetical protein
MRFTALSLMPRTCLMPDPLQRTFEPGRGALLATLRMASGPLLSLFVRHEDPQQDMHHQTETSAEEERGKHQPPSLRLLARREGDPGVPEIAARAVQGGCGVELPALKVEFWCARAKGRCFRAKEQT